MKKIFTLTLFIFGLCIHTNAQVVTTKQTALTLIQQRNVYLNGGLRATTADGKSRVAFKIDLPEGTKRWYYSFSTSPGTSGTANLNLAIQLSGYLVDATGITSTVASNLKVPPGSAAVDAYVMDQTNSDAFIKKVDNDGGTFYYLREGTIQTTKQAVVEIDDVTRGTVYLGFKNPSTLDGVNVFLEVVALVETNELSEEQTQAINLGNLGWKAFERGDLNKCLDLSQQALKLDNSLAYVHYNIGLVYLIKGNSNEALNRYSKAMAITRKNYDPVETLKAAIEDITSNISRITSKSDANDILSLLRLELEGFQ